MLVRVSDVGGFREADPPFFYFFGTIFKTRPLALSVSR